MARHRHIRGGRQIARCAGAVLCLLVLVGPLAAQDAAPRAAPFLIINQERILLDSEAGKTILAVEEAKRRDLVAEARSIDAAFEMEERELTEKRKTLPPEEFQALAEDFDKRVVAARQTQDERSDTLAQELEQARRQFFAEVAPVLVSLMDQFGAYAILDENSVLLADQRLNITEAVIREIDANFAEQSSGAEATDEDEIKEDQP